MKCIEKDCDGETRVYKTVKYDECVYRYRYCVKCGQHFKSVEERTSPIEYAGKEAAHGLG